jgi:hypothetical protein
MKIAKALAGFWYIKDANGVILGVFPTFRRARQRWQELTGEVLSMDD